MNENDQMWNMLCQEDTLVSASIIYGMSWPGFVGYSKHPVSSLLCSSFFFVPLTVIGVACVATVLPKNFHGCIPLALAVGTFRCLTSNKE